MIRLKLRPKMVVYDAIQNFLTWKKNFDWLCEFVIRPLERLLGIFGVDGGMGAEDTTGMGAPGVTSTPAAMATVDAAYASLLLRVAWEETIAVSADAVVSCCCRCRCRSHSRREFMKWFSVAVESP